MCFKYKATEFSGQERKHLKVCAYKPSESCKSSTASICLAIPSSHMLGGPLLLVTGFTILKNCYVSEIALINWSKLLYPKFSQVLGKVTGAITHYIGFLSGIRKFSRDPSSHPGLSMVKAP